MKYRLNLNCSVKVKLTDLGKDIYYHRFDDFNYRYGKQLTPSFPKEDENGYSTFQLWHFMQLYGSYMSATKPNVILPLEIEMDGEDLEEVTE